MALDVPSRFGLHYLLFVFIVICERQCNATFKTPFDTSGELTRAVDIYLDYQYNDDDKNNNASVATMFQEIIDTYGDIGDWDVSNVRDFSRLFSTERNPLSKNFTADLSRWIVDNAKYMNEMFMGSSLFNSNLHAWNVNNVTNFQRLFKGTSNFLGQGLDRWDVSSGMYMNEMFSGASSFNADVSGWKVDNVLYFQELFKGATKFTGRGIDKWNVSKGRLLSEMFSGASSFDSDLATWQVDQVTHFQGLFNGATNFTGRGLEQWNVSNGLYFMIMFAGTKNLRKDLDLRRWRVDKAERMGGMFRNSNFGQNDGLPTNDLCPWINRLRSNVEMESMFVGSNCPNTNDPDLSSIGQGTSFCVHCISVTGQTSSSSSSSSSFRPSTNKQKDGSSTSESKKKPNILLIMTDQQRFDAIQRVQQELTHFQNVTTVRTPNLDKLSRMGAFFRNAYCQCPVCGPARTSLRTGCTIERTGVQTNKLTDHFWGMRVFEDRVRALVSIDHILSEAGYTIEYYGKWHAPNLLFQNKNKTSVMQSNYYDYETNQFSFSRSTIGSKLKTHWNYFNRLGLISKDLSEGQQKDTYSYYPYKPVMVDTRYGHPTGTSLSHENGFRECERTESNVCGEFGLSHHYTPTHFIGDMSRKALERLIEQKNENNPFFLTVSFHNPHPPMLPPTKHLRYYMDNQDTLPISPTIHDAMTNSAYDADSARMPKYANEQAIRQWTAVYYALIEEIDDYIGILLETLGDTIDDTVLIFTSDHGEMLGAHGRRGKTVFYEESVHVPLFISYPSQIQRNTIIEENVSHLDVVATILDYVGLSSHDNSDGTSLRKFIDQTSYNEKYDEDVVVAEWDFRDPDKTATPPYSNLKNHLGAVPSYMIRKGQYKLLIRKNALSKEIDVLYDLSTDPHETSNLLGQNSPTASIETIAKAEHLRCLLIDWMKRLDDEGERRKTGGGSSKADDDISTTISTATTAPETVVHYYSDPEANYGEGQGDIMEIQFRQSWRSLDIWISDTKIYLGKPSLVIIDDDDDDEMDDDNQENQTSATTPPTTPTTTPPTPQATKTSFVRYHHRRREYFYIGTRTPGNKNITYIDIVGKDQHVITIDKQTLVLKPFECSYITITYTSLPSSSSTTTKYVNNNNNRNNHNNGQGPPRKFGNNQVVHVEGHDDDEEESETFIDVHLLIHIDGIEEPITVPIIFASSTEQDE